MIWRLGSKSSDDKGWSRCDNKVTAKALTAEDAEVAEETSEGRTPRYSASSAVHALC
jgi:hypothetical protein